MGEPAVRIDILATALKYALRAWFVFPVHYVREDRSCSCGRVCGRVGKHPATPNGWKDATVATEPIKSWWGQNPNYNIGIACGPSKLLVVDVDPRNEGDASFADLQARHGELPPTLTANTGGGGQHYYYDVSGVDGIFKGRVLAQGVELQGAGQYVVASPSNHLLGTYRWDFGQPAQPAFPPPWLIEEQSRRSSISARAGAPLDCILGVAFSAAGMMGQAIGPDRMAVQCPWESDHSQGSRFDGSTIVFGAAKGKWGWFHCSHAHCKERLQAMDAAMRNSEIMSALPPAAAELATKKIKGADRELRRVVRAEWERSLQWNSRGERLLPTAGNLRLMMENMKEWNGCIAYDESTDRMFWTITPPEVPGLPTPVKGADMTESDWIHVSQWFSLNKSVEFPKLAVGEVMFAAGRQNSHNSLTDYIEGLQWDGKPRIDTWLHDYCGARDSVAGRVIGRSWLISAIARALEPGCQVDHSLVLEGAQGLGKTSVFRILGGKWYLGNLPRLEDKDSRHILSGSWIVEMQELAAIRGTMIERVKAYLTERWDQYRPPYARDFVKRPRRCVFGATTNEGEWNGDNTGARRFWPVKVYSISATELERDRNQLWAEARDRFIAGESFWVPRGMIEVHNELKEEQEARRVEDPWKQTVERHVLREDPIFIERILTDLGIEPGRRVPADANRVARVLASLGYVRRRITYKGERPWAYVKPAAAPVDTASPFGGSAE